MNRCALLAELVAKGLLEPYTEIEYVYEFGRRFDGRPAYIEEHDDGTDEIVLVPDRVSLDELVNNADSVGFDGMGDAAGEGGQ